MTWRPGSATDQGELAPREVLGAMLTELLSTVDRDDAFGEAIFIAAESLLRLIDVAERPEDVLADEASVEDVREVLSLMRAGVVTTTSLLWSLDDRRRHKLIESARARRATASDHQA